MRIVKRCKKHWKVLVGCEGNLDNSVHLLRSQRPNSRPRHGSGAPSRCRNEAANDCIRYDHVRPIQGPEGCWRWKIGGEHGEPLQGNITVNGPAPQSMLNFLLIQGKTWSFGCITRISQTNSLGFGTLWVAFSVTSRPRCCCTILWLPMFSTVACTCGGRGSRAQCPGPLRPP